jgi:hypothetical protein
MEALWPDADQRHHVREALASYGAAPKLFEAIAQVARPSSG